MPKKVSKDRKVDPMEELDGDDEVVVEETTPTGNEGVVDEDVVVEDDDTALIDELTEIQLAERKKSLYAIGCGTALLFTIMFFLTRCSAQKKKAEPEFFVTAANAVFSLLAATASTGGMYYLLKSSMQKLSIMPAIENTYEGGMLTTHNSVPPMNETLLRDTTPNPYAQMPRTPMPCGPLQRSPTPVPYANQVKNYPAVQSVGY